MTKEQGFNNTVDNEDAVTFLLYPPVNEGDLWYAKFKHSYPELTGSGITENDAMRYLLALVDQQ